MLPFALMVALTTAPSPTPTPKQIARVTATPTPKIAPEAPYVPQDCRGLIARAQLTGDINPRYVGVLMAQALAEHNGDFPMQVRSLQRAEADVFGSENGPGCFNLHPRLVGK